MGWRRVFVRAARDRERADEFQAHLDLLADDYRARGLGPDEARRRARLALGNPRAMREAIDDMNRLPLLDPLARDVRYALRILRRSPAFTATAVMTLALVIGGNTVVASLADSLLLKPLPYPQPDRLAVVVTNVRGAASAPSIDDSQDGTSWETLRDQARSVDVAMYAGSFGGGVNMVIDQAAVTVSQSRVSAGFFRVIGIAPAIGREFTRDEDRPGGPAVAVISDRLWQRYLHADRAVLGKTMLLRGEAYTIVGVMPEAFRPPDLTMSMSGGPVDVWTPARPSRTGEGGGTNYGVIARVKAGQRWAEANAELEALGRASFGARGLLRNGGDAWWTLLPMQEAVTTEVRQPILILAGAMAMVLLIACVNIAALLLARGGSRSREIATRVALGGGRGAVIRQLMVESVVLALIGGVVGVFVGAVGLAGLKALAASTFSTWTHATLDIRVLAATAGLSLITSLLFGLVPALQVSRLDVTTALATGGSRGIAGGPAHWTRRVLVATEIALGVVLLVLTGLLVRTFVNLRTLEPGFDASSVTTASVSLLDARYASADRVSRLFERSQEALEQTPGVVSAAVSLELPYRRLLNYGFRFLGDSGDDAKMTTVMYVTPHFFDTLKIPLRRGRDFTTADRADAPGVAIVNDTFVRTWARGANPIGRRITLRDGFDREIVGVVGDVLLTNQGIGFPGARPGPLMTAPLVFVPAAQTSDAFLRMVHTWFQPMWSVRTNGNVNVASVLPRAIHAADPMLPVQNVRSLSAVEAAATGLQRLLLTLVGGISLAALVLAAMGVFGLIAHGIAERTREFGIRLALGATVGDTIRRLTVSGVLVAAVGVAAGVGLAWMAVAVFDSYAFLFRVDKHDPLTFTAVGAFLLVVAALASALPALRVLRLDPAKVLRE